MLPAADKLVLRLTVIVGVLGLNVHPRVNEQQATVG
jgi:hypothetical protein